jgi:hypothetical protein
VAASDWVASRRSADTTPNSSQTLRQIILKTTAKRYTKPVDVAAVRDLYGTVMNEGANRGSLITTSSYGPDAYEFAKNKPLSLVDGPNLLLMLQRHGKKFRLDLAEARRLLQENGPPWLRHANYYRHPHFRNNHRRRLSAVGWDLSGAASWRLQRSSRIITEFLKSNFTDPYRLRMSSPTTGRLLTSSKLNSQTFPIMSRLWLTWGTPRCDCKIRRLYHIFLRLFASSLE